MVALIGAPDGFTRTLGDLPEAARLSSKARGRADLVLWFVRNRKQLERDLGRMARLPWTDGLWIAWAKQSSPLAGDVSEAIVREAGLSAGLVDYKVCAVDADWSGLKFARRKS